MALSEEDRMNEKDFVQYSQFAFVFLHPEKLPLIANSLCRPLLSKQHGECLPSPFTSTGQRRVGLELPASAVCPGDATSNTAPHAPAVRPVLGCLQKSLG